MFTVIKPGTHIDFMKHRYFFFFLSGLLILFSIIMFSTKGINYGIDFTGGVEVQVKFKDSSVKSELIRRMMKDVTAGDLQVQSFGDTKYNEYLIRVEGEEANLGDLTKNIEKILDDKFGSDSHEIRRVDLVGPKVGRELRLGGFYSILYALIGILIYIALRFDYKFSPGAVIALIHDVVITMGVFSLTQRQFSLSTIAALLTIIGYSLNDTIVVYDRIRETMGQLKGTVLESVVNRALNITLSRTILTSVTTLFVVSMLLIFGGSVIRDFAFALFIGVIVGTYSSIFVASPVLINMDKLLHKTKNVQ